MRSISVLLLCNVLLVKICTAQEALPQFSVAGKSNGKVIISWHNNFQSVTQISIQRSSDSLKNFTTLLTVPDPIIPENGFVDGKPPRLNMFYRLFIVLDSGNYIFSKSKRALPDTASVVVTKNTVTETTENPASRNDNQRVTYVRPADKPKTKPAIVSKPPELSKVEVERTIYIKQKDSVIGQTTSKNAGRFKDSVLKKTKDTLVYIGTDTILVKTFVPKEVYRVSNYVYAGKDGNISIALPDAAAKKYTVKFLEQDLSPVLEIKDIKQTLLVVDKTNFFHNGWFRFELYEDGKLKEKNKFFIPKDF